MMASRDRTEAARARAASSKRKPAIKVAPVPEAARDAEQRAKNAVDHETKLREAEAHRLDIERRVATRTADRQKRAAEKKAKEAKEAARTTASAATRS